MCNFIKSLGEAVGYCAMNANTEVRVFAEDEFCVVVPACRNEVVEGGYPMTAHELEEFLSHYETDDLGGYESNVSVSDMKVVDDGMVVLYGVSAAAVC